MVLKRMLMLGGGVVWDFLANSAPSILESHAIHELLGYSRFLTVIMIRETTFCWQELKGRSYCPHPNYIKRSVPNRAVPRVPYISVEILLLNHNAKTQCLPVVKTQLSQLDLNG